MAAVRDGRRVAGRGSAGVATWSPPSSRPPADATPSLYLSFAANVGDLDGTSDGDVARRRRVRHSRDGEGHETARGRATCINDYPRHGIGYLPFGGRSGPGTPVGLGCSVGHIAAYRTKAYNYRGRTGAHRAPLGAVPAQDTSWSLPTKASFNRGTLVLTGSGNHIAQLI